MRVTALGTGLPKNYIEAYAWASLAAVDGLAEAVTTRDTFASELTSQALVAAQARAAKLFKEIEQRKKQK